MEKVQQAVQSAAGMVGATKLPTAKLGKNGPQVTRLGFGAMGLSAFYGKPKPDEERFAVLDKCYADGELFIDTSDIYMDNEDLLGAWFKANPGKREKIFLASKFAAVRNADGSRSVDSTPEYCLKACEKSLRRLGVSYIDLYYVHRLDQKTPIEKTMKALQQLKSEGKIRYVGLSECSAATLRRACAVEHVDAIQIEYSPFSLDIESEKIGLLKACRELGVAIVCYSPIGRGVLGGTIRSPDDLADDDFRKHAPRWSKENFPKNLVLVDAITAMAKKRGATPSQMTLAWILAQGDDFFPIPGTTNLGRLEENLAAAHLQLTEEEVKQIRKLSEEAEVAGDRYPEAASGNLFADTPELEA